jgi:iron complex transport system ATP-binding protein
VKQQMQMDKNTPYDAPAGLPHLQVIAPDALYLTRGGKQRTFTSFGKLLEEIK